MNFKLKPGGRENDTIKVAKRFQGPKDVPVVPYTQAQIDTMSQKSYDKLPIFFRTKDSAPFNNKVIDSSKKLFEGSTGFDKAKSFFQGLISGLKKQ